MSRTGKEDGLRKKGLLAVLVAGGLLVAASGPTLAAATLDEASAPSAAIALGSKPGVGSGLDSTIALGSKPGIGSGSNRSAGTSAV